MKSSDARHSIFSGLAALSLAMIAHSAISWTAFAQDETKKGPIQLTMRQKLDAAAKVLEGLAVENADVVLEGTQVLMSVSKAEMWQILKDSEYREHTQTFRGSIRRLEAAARKSEFAAAQLEWLGATKTCFDCHNHIRGSKSAEAK